MTKAVTMRSCAHLINGEENKGKTRREKRCETFVGVSVLLSLFSGNIHLAFLSVIRAASFAGSTSKIYLSLLLIYNLLVVAYASSVYKRRIDLRIVTLIMCLYGILACALFCTYNSATFKNVHLLSEIQSYLISWMICLTAAVALAKVGVKGLCGIDRFLPVVIILYTFGSLFALMFSSGLTTGGLMSDDSGLNYQSNSYCAAYAIGLTLYYLTHFDVSGKLWIFRLRFFARPFWCALVVCQSAVLVLSGGRGGLVAAFLAAVYCVYTQRRTLAFDVRKILVSCILVLVGALLFVKVIGILTVEYNGIGRIVGFLDGAGDSNRSGIASEAIAAFSAAPLLGNGAGSVFGLLGTYSHNCFLDILVEYGLVGLLLVIAIVIASLFKLKKCINNNSGFEIFGYSFVLGFSMLLVSSYYIVCVLVILPVMLVALWPNPTGDCENKLRCAVLQEGKLLDEEGCNFKYSRFRN